MLRGLCLAAASLTMGLALKVMPVAEMVAIVDLAPVAVMILAWRLLGDEVNLVGWLGAVAGIAGVLLIVRPGTGLDPVGVALCLINAGLAATYTLLTLATAGHFLFTAACREAPASSLAPVNYLHLAWAAILGWRVFGHVPDGITILGMTLVVLAGVAQG